MGARTGAAVAATTVKDLHFMLCQTTHRRLPQGRRLATAVAALGLVASVSACSGSGLGGMFGGADPAGGSGVVATAPATATSRKVVLDQHSPEAAVTSWLNALVAGDGAAVCRVRAKNGKPIASIKGAVGTCQEAVTPMLGSLSDLDGMLDGLTITGATVKGSEATFETAVTDPQIASRVVQGVRAERIDGKWYVTQ